jgi:peptide/nickel transport system substrate-binding protein
MSITSWAYPKNITEHEKVAFTRTRREIEALVESAGWEKNPSDKKYYKDGKKLKITFTIAGETTDHPAYAMFEDAATFLNSCGFEITVTTDITALKKLATGGLQVWAAAWSSTIDPDMYQVYHKDSSATSVKNWGYPTIMADTTGQFDDEKEIIEELSLLIEQGRETINQDERKEIYAEALDKVMELCVELPTYQRNDLAVYNADVIATETLNENPTATAGVVDRLWELNYVGAASIGGNAGQDEGGNTGLIIGIVVGVVVLAGAAVAVLFVMKKKKAAEPIIVDDEEEVEEVVEEVEEVAEEENSDNE